MIHLVKRGTARRLGLHPVDPLKHYRRRWAIDIDGHLPAPWGSWGLAAIDHGHRPHRRDEAVMTTSDRCPMCSKPVESTVLAVNAPGTIRHTDGTECAMFSRPPVTLAVEDALAPYLPPVPIAMEAP